MTSQTMLINVKPADDNIQAFSISCQPNWTVRDLKHQISVLCLCNPPPASQRIIHSGKLLQDSVIIETLFTVPDEPQTVHLVCRQLANSKRPVSQARSNKETDALESLSEAEMKQYQQEYYQYLQSFYLNHLNQPNDGVPASSAWPCFNPTFAYPYQGLSAAGYSISSQQPFPVASTAQPVSQAEPSNGETSFAPVEARANRVIDRARALLAGLNIVEPAGRVNAAEQEVVAAPEEIMDRAQQPQRQGQNEQAAAIVDPAAGPMGDGPGDVDIIDRLYLLFRLGLMLCLCFSYTSLDKAIIVFSIAAYMYFYNIYRRHAAARPVVQIQQPQRQPADAENQQQEQQQSTQSVEAAEASLADSSTEQQTRQRVVHTSQSSTEASVNEAVPIPPVREPRFVRLTGTIRSVAMLSYQFVSSFIASLIPEQPPPMRFD